MKLNPVCQKLLSKFETYAHIQGNITETDRVQGKAHWAEVSSVQMSSKGDYSEARWRCCSCLLLLPVSVCVTIWCSSVCSLINSRQWSGGSMQICCFSYVVLSYVIFSYDLCWWQRLQNVSSAHHGVPMQRSHSPVDQIIEESAYQCRVGGGTDSPGSTSGTSSSGSSGYPVDCQLNFLTMLSLNMCTHD